MTVVFLISLFGNACLVAVVAYLVSRLIKLATQTDKLRVSVRNLMRAYEDLDRGFAEYRKASAQAAYSQRSGKCWEAAKH
jgi:hypothetical protein